MNLSMTLKITVAACTLLISSLTVAQSCNENLERSAPDYRFIDHGDGTFTDNATQLMWTHCFLGETWDGQSCTGEAISRDWDTVLVETEASSFANHNDWRLPNTTEFWSIQETACLHPATNMNFFGSDTYFFVWTATPKLNENLKAYQFTFGGVTSGIPRSFGSSSVENFVTNRALMVRYISN